MSRRTLTLFLAGLILAAPPLLLSALALPRLISGMALASVQPVIQERLYARPIATPALVAASETLANASPYDGQSQIWRAELDALLARDAPERLRQARLVAVDGLAENPANPRGWTLLCEIDAELERADAASCIDTAFFIGPFDWFVLRRHLVLVAHLWPRVDSDTRDAAQRMLRRVWEKPELRGAIYDLDQRPNGAAMLTAAFADDKDTLRAVNRWLIHQRQWGTWHGPGEPP